MAYTAILKRSAEKELARLPEPLHRRIAAKLLELERHPRPPGVQKRMATMAIEFGLVITGCCI